MPRRSILFVFLSALICVNLLFLTSCSSQRVDLRTLVPAETLVYLESDDLGVFLTPLVESSAFAEAASQKPDLSALKGVRVAVAVTGFETSEIEITEDQSVGRVQPRFVAIADTNAWNYQVLTFAEHGLGSFVEGLFQSEAKLEKTDKHGGKFLTWTAADGRKSFALVIDGLIWFGNDESAIEKSLAVRRGEAESIAKAGKLPQRVPNTLASGYLSADGVAQAASLAGMSLASQTSDDEDVRSAIATLLPQLIRGTVTDVAWTASQNSQGYEDRFTIGGNAETAPVLAEAFVPTGSVDAELFQFVPNNSPGITLYNLEKPNIAWRGMVLTARSRVNEFGSRVIGEFSNAFAEPYGIADAEKFLTSVGPNIVAIRTDAEGDQPAVIATVKDAAMLRTSLDPELKPDKAASDASGFETLKSEDTTAVFAGRFVVVGDSDAVAACIKAKAEGTSLGIASPAHLAYFRPNNSAVTLSSERDLAPAIADLLSERKAQAANTISITETRFSRSGTERRVVSDLGFIGWLLARMSER